MRKVAAILRSQVGRKYYKNMTVEGAASLRTAGPGRRFVKIGSRYAKNHPEILWISACITAVNIPETLIAACFFAACAKSVQFNCVKIFTQILPRSATPAVKKSCFEGRGTRTIVPGVWQNKFSARALDEGVPMNVNDGNIPKDVSWVDYCDALADEAWLDTRNRSLLAKKLDLRIDLRDHGKGAAIPKESPAVNGEGRNP